MTQAIDPSVAPTPERTPTMLTHEGRTLSIWAWAREPQQLAMKLRARVIYERKRDGWSDEKALTTPPRFMNRDGNGTCAVCKEIKPRDQLTRGSKCTSCLGVNITATSLTSRVHPTLPWLEDFGARALVVHHPDGMTLEEVGQAFGVTRERIRQIEASAKAKFLRACVRLGIDPAEMLSAIRERNEDAQEQVTEPVVKRLRPVGPPADESPRPFHPRGAVVPEDGLPESAEALALDAALRAYERAADRLVGCFLPVEGDVTTNDELARRRRERAEEDAMPRPNLIEWRGVSKSATEWADDPHLSNLSLTGPAISERIKRGWTVEETLTTAKGSLPERLIAERAKAQPAAQDSPTAALRAEARVSARKVRRAPQETVQAVREVLTSVDPVELLGRLGWDVEELGGVPAGRLLVIKGGSDT